MPEASYHKTYYEQNKEKVKQKNREYRLRTNHAAGKKYREANKEKATEYTKEYYQNNKEVISIYTKKYREENKEKFLENSLKKLYGITLEEYNNMLKDQAEGCKICSVKQKDLKYALHVDHCHVTGKVRGLLCKKCNSALGLFGDNIDLLNKATIYLAESTNKNK